MILVLVLSPGKVLLNHSAMGTVSLFSAILMCLSLSSPRKVDPGMVSNKLWDKHNDTSRYGKI